MGTQWQQYLGATMKFFIIIINSFFFKGHSKSVSHKISDLFQADPRDFSFNRVLQR